LNRLTSFDWSGPLDWTRQVDWRGQLDRQWLRWTFAFWAGAIVWYLWQRWGVLYWLTLSDTDDNMRLLQVRAWMSGQEWFDLRQYRLNPPDGLDIHWSRIVDLPLAGLILFFRLFTTPEWAERWAIGIAPLLPLGIVLVALALTARRLVAPRAWPLALVLMLGTSATMLMFMPGRIDHHGWQLAALAVTVAALADPSPRRGGALVGAAGAFSLGIGLEMLPYVAASGAVLALRWVWDRDEAPRLAAYGAALGLGTAAAYLGFASEANRALRCDALTPPWLTVMTAAGAALFVLARIGPRARWARFALAAAAGAIIAGGFAALFPQCLGRPEGVSDELARMWLNNVREAKPIYAHPLRNAVPMAMLPVIGLVGAIVATLASWRGPRFALWLPVTAFAAFAAAMLLWQVRAGPAAQLLAIPGTVALLWMATPWLIRRAPPAVRVIGIVAAFLIASGLLPSLVLRALPGTEPDRRTRIVNEANRRCPTLPSLRPLNRLTPAIVFTHVDLGPRLAVATHHRTITGPYHRNEAAILGVHRAFQGSDEQFLTIARRYGATYLLTCPNMAETTVYRARSPQGFYARLSAGQVPDYLEPVPLSPRSPLKLWRIKAPSR
jgi:hypothetical protein